MSTPPKGPVTNKTATNTAVRVTQKENLSRKSKSQNLLFLFDQRCFDVLQSGAPPQIPYSHDKNLLLFAHEALRHGDTVYFSRSLHDALQGQLLKVTQIYPVFEATFIHFDASTVDLVTSSGLEQLNVRQHFPKAKIVGVVPALHMIESPLMFSGEHPLNWINAVRYHIDFFITQNDRMKDILSMLVHWLARWDASDRIIVAPLGYAPEAEFTRKSYASARKKFGIAAKDILIVNSGGAWPWTDCDTCVEAFLQYHKTHTSNLKLYFPALRQADNFEFNPVADKIEALRRSNPTFFGTQLSDNKPICIESSWEAAGARLPDVLSASDIGLNVSKDSFEGWQSHRVRFVDYIANDIPVLTTTENLLSLQIKNSCLKVTSEQKSEYIQVFEKLETDKTILENLKHSVKNEKQFLSSRNTYYPAIEKIKSGKVRKANNDLHNVIDAEIEQVIHSLKQKTFGIISKSLGI